MKEIKKLFISDIHFGKKGIRPIDDMLEKLFLSNNDSFVKLDYIILSGDYFDCLLDLNSKYAKAGIESLFMIGGFCERHNIKLRILEGTPSHDRRQISTFNTLIPRLLPNLDYKYIDDIEVVVETDHTCLYIPDEIRSTVIDSYNEILEIMKSEKINMFDSCVMHGAFNHSLGFGDETTLWNEEKMLGIVKGYIVCGHIHTHQTFSRIITPGSFTRLSHGQEEPKGVIYTIEGEVPIIKFIENKEANTFNTYKIKSETYPDLIVELGPIISKLPFDAKVRLQIDDGNNIPNVCNTDDLKFHKEQMIEFQTKKIVKKELVVEREIMERRENITNDTVKTYVSDNIDNEFDLSTILETIGDLVD